jgi:hypothetical protein
MTYRIVKVDNHFEVEYKWLFWWISVKEFFCDTLGFGGEYTIQFTSLDDAKSYIEKQVEIREVVKEYVYED